MDQSTIPFLFLGIGSLVISGVVFTMDFDSRIMHALQILCWLTTQFTGTLFTFHGVMLDPGHLFTAEFWGTILGGGSLNMLLRLCAGTILSVCIPLVFIFLINRITRELDGQDGAVMG